MAKAQGPRVIDRSAGRRLQVDVRHGTGLEAVLCLMILNGDSSFENFDRGEEITRIVKRGLPASVDRAVARLRTPSGDPWSALLGMLVPTRRPHDLLTVVDRIERMAPSDLKLAMLGFNRLPVESRNDPGPVVFRSAADGDKAAIAALLKASSAGGRDAELRPVLRMSASDLADLVVRALRDLPPDLYSVGGAAELLERNSFEAQRLLADTEDVEPVIERLTRGLIYRPEPGIVGVVLVPTLVHRPWTLVLDHERRKVFCYPARLDAELSAPDHALIGIYRALGDGTRLKILRRLATGAASVARISEELGLAKSTVHEHLLSLRTAGLVRLPVSGGFELEPELPDLNWLLKDFLGLEMRHQCEGCGTPLDPDGVAFICSFECTFCHTCAEDNELACPNCAGELVLRPRRLKNPLPRGHRTRPHRYEVQKVRS